jgi:hypothetical protein
VLLVSGVVALAGVGFVFLDPGVYPVDSAVGSSLGQGVLGATLLGWGVTLFLVARYAFAEKKPELLRLLLYGLVAWAPVDLAVSVNYGAWFNVILNIGILVLAGVPLYLASRAPSE